MHTKTKERIDKIAGICFSKRTIRLVWLDLLRLRARVKQLVRRNVNPKFDKLHCGCGDRRVKRWLNVDLKNSDQDLDLLGKLPWKSEVFRVIVCQHVIEHFELVDELLPLLREFNRILMPEGELWLSTPDLEKVCISYIQNQMTELVNERRRMWGSYSMNGVPTQHFINIMFHQHGYHKNLFDFTLAEWMLREAGFDGIRRTSEKEFLACFPEFPERNDDLESLYVFARKRG